MVRVVAPAGNANVSLRKYLDVPPLAVKKYSSWGVLAFQEDPDRFGRFPSTNADAARGLSVMGLSKQGELRCDSLRDASSVTVHLVNGNVSEGHAAPESRALAQRAKVGNCPCCSISTCADAPVSYTWRGFPAQKAQGVDL